MSTTVYLYDNVLLDKEYRNISNIRVSASTRTPVKSYTGLSFQRVESEIINSGSPRLAGTIRLPLNNDLEVLRKCGYMTFQNSGDIKYYAFIDEVNYINAGNVEIRYTIDDFQTYLTDYLNNWTDECFVEQEHINRSADIARELDGTTQNIAPKTLFWNKNNYYKYSVPKNAYLGMSLLYDEALQQSLQEKGFRVFTMNGGKSSLMFAELGSREFTQDDVKNIIEVLSSAERYKYVMDFVTSSYPLISSFRNNVINTDFKLYPNNINNYYFKNAMLGTYPFNQFFIKSSNGESVKINSRDCTNDGNGNLSVVLTIGGYLPKYAYVSVSPSGIYQSDERPSSNKMVKFPCSMTLPIQRDQLLTFLYTNASTSIASLIGSIGSIAAGGLLLGTGAGAGAGVAMIAGGVGSAIGTLGNSAQQLVNTLEPTGSFDGNTYSLYNKFQGFEVLCYSPSINEAHMIDDYFSMYGYVTNKVKIPNIKNRNNFNFVKCHDISNFRGVPPRAKTAMTNAFSKGVFIWHNLGQIGNYDIDTNG